MQVSRVSRGRSNLVYEQLADYALLKSSAAALEEIVNQAAGSRR